MYGSELKPGTKVRFAVGVILLDRDQRILMQRHTGGDLWCLPGGRVEPGETVEEAAVREVYEATTFAVKVHDLMGIYSHPSGRIITFPDNGDVRHLVDAIVTGSIVSGDLKPVRHNFELRFFHRDHLPDTIAPPARAPLLDFLAGRRAMLR